MRLAKHVARTGGTAMHFHTSTLLQSITDAVKYCEWCKRGRIWEMERERRQLQSNFYAACNGRRAMQRTASFSNATPSLVLLEKGFGPTAPGVLRSWCDGGSSGVCSKDAPLLLFSPSLRVTFPSTASLSCAGATFPRLDAHSNNAAGNVTSPVKANTQRGTSMSESESALTTLFSNLL